MKLPMRVTKLNERCIDGGVVPYKTTLDTYNFSWSSPPLLYVRIRTFVLWIGTHILVS